jgi:cellulose synthase/poly-beta-1,6-N-acetylglucosamine synthase-like glycosyltransferase
MAYNEEHNIVRALHAVLNQRLSQSSVVEIIVVASGCTDRTVDLAEEVARAHPIIRVEAQAKRLGKAAAINRLIQLARGEVILLVGADTLPDPTAFEHLVKPFEDAGVGMTGGRVVPLNDPRTFLGLTIQILWRVHHRMAMRWPKLGELVAFRNVVAELPVNTATDEVALEALISALGYRLVYTPDAVVYNRGPETLGEFLVQRRRIFAGHLHIAATYGYMAASMHPSHLILLAAEAFNRYSFLLFLLLGAAMLEVWARLLGTTDFILGHRFHIWPSVPSTKRVAPHAQPLTLVILQYPIGTVKPAHLVRRMRHIPESQGVLFWWYQHRSQVLFMLPGEATANAVESQVKTLAAQVGSNGTMSSKSVVSYRVVQFPALLPSA